jgi:hypothetical protein
MPGRANAAVSACPAVHGTCRSRICWRIVTVDWRRVPVGDFGASVKSRNFVAKLEGGFELVRIVPDFRSIRMAEQWQDGNCRWPP